ncbi:hypothetical protein ONZ45_g5178 [Pleurotus djamor]|nr:hypothetical protein ONZ45_g5178 [Pleurotus djamor]
MTSKKQIVVVGAGVVGLTTALRLQRTALYQVTIISETLPTDPKTVKYTSHWAGANHVSFEPKGSYKHEIDKETFGVMWDMSAPGSSTEHLFLRIRQREMYHNERPRPSGLDHMPNFRYLNPEELPFGAVDGVTFETITIDTPRYLRYLLAEFLSIGGLIKQATVQHVNQIIEGGINVYGNGGPSPSADSIFVCTGLGTRVLGGVEDTTMLPYRGQTVLLRAPWVKQGLTLSRPDGWAYIIPRRSGDVIVGGTRDADDWYPKARPETTESILTYALAVYPELAPPHLRTPDLPAPTIEALKPLIIEEGCGFRPGRKAGLRLEVEWFNRVDGGTKIPVVYNYGHDGSGFQSSWGSAAVAVRLLEDALSKGPE